MTAVAVTASPTKQQFIEQVNANFHASAPNGSEFEMLLAEFRDVLDSDTQETFTLIFRAPAEVQAEQGTYGVSNPGIGEQAIFLVPIGRDDRSVYFEAVYNRFKK